MNSKVNLEMNFCLQILPYILMGSFVQFKFSSASYIPLLHGYESAVIELHFSDGFGSGEEKKTGKKYRKS